MVALLAIKRVLGFCYERCIIAVDERASGKANESMLNTFSLSALQYVISHFLLNTRGCVVVLSALTWTTLTF